MGMIVVDTLAPRYFAQPQTRFSMERMDNPQVRKVKTREQGTDFAYWQSRTPQARLEALESIRSE
jgi:hypothetical protein